MKIEAACINSACLAKDFKTEEVVRLADVDELIQEAVWAMELVIDRIRYRNDLPQQTFNELEVLCMKDRNYQRAQAFLASPTVQAWRERQEGKK